jgi:HlyD family secretion protein
LKKLILIYTLILTGVAGIGITYYYYSRPAIPEIDVETITRRDLRAVASASGTIQPKLSVDISASVMGRVTRLAVEEGDRVSAGQFLLQIDPENLQAAVNRGEASLEATRASRTQAEVSVETAQVNLELARENLTRQEELWSLRLIARELYDQAIAQTEVRKTELRAREVEVEAGTQRIRQEQAMLDSARYDLTQVTITSPIEGIVTRRNIEEGETVVVGTMNNAGTVLLTIADFSILEAELEVDETDIPAVTFAQSAEITIDALPDDIYTGRVTEIGNSPIQLAGQSATSGQEATNFKVVVTLDDNVPGVRPGFTCTADITTAIRERVIAVPIQSTTVREVEIDTTGQIVRTNTEPSPSGLTIPTSAAETTPDLRDPPLSKSFPSEGEALEEREGVFVVRNGRAVFIPVATGIAGERYFEALNGLTEGDQVITGPFDVVRNIVDGDPVRISDPEAENSFFSFGTDGGGLRIEF